MGGCATPESVTAIILAGGMCSRMGKLGALLPKALLPVSREQTLLTRTLDDLADAGLTTVIISTSPERYPQFLQLVTRYRAIRSAWTPKQGGRLELISNAARARSSIHALAAVINRGSVGRVLMCLGDIYFESNPYSALVDRFVDIGDRGAIVVHETTTKEAARRGGLAFVDGGVTTGFAIAFSDAAQRFPGRPTLWSGATLFGSEIGSDLAAYLNDSASTLEEDFLNFTLAKGQQYSAVAGPNFVNVNSFDDFSAIIRKVGANGRESQ